jgi:hypothetical protein
VSGADDIQFDTRGSRPSFFDNATQDVFMTALLETMSQVWAARDYAAGLEKLLVEKGLIEAGELEALRWSAAEEAANEARREAFLKDAFRAVNADFTTVARRNEEIDSFDEADLGA